MNTRRALAQAHTVAAERGERRLWSADADAAAALLKGQVAVVAIDGYGNRANAARVHIAAALDDRYATGRRTP